MRGILTAGHYINPQKSPRDPARRVGPLWELSEPVFGEFSESGRARSLRLPLEFRLMLFEESPDLAGEAEQALPLLDVKSHRHPLEPIDAHRPFLAHLAVKRATPLLELRQELG